MLGTKTIISSLLSVSSLTLFGATPEYLPLQVGNSWVYNVTRGRTASEPATIEVQGISSFGGKDYYRVSFFGQIAFLRTADDGTVFTYDQTANQERAWIPFGAPDGQVFTTSIDPCTTNGKIQSHTEKITVPLGTFDSGLSISYSGTCADAGVSGDVFLPYVGLLRRTTVSIAGPVTYEMTYVRSGSTVSDSSKLSFGMVMDAVSYTAGPSAQASVRLSLRNSSSEEIPLTFPSGQSYDLNIRNDKGEIVYTWSANKAFSAIFRMERFGPGERNYPFTIPLSGLPAGHYTAEGFLATQPRQFSTSIGFDIR